MNILILNKHSFENKTQTIFFQRLKVVFLVTTLFSFGNANAQYCTPGTVSGCVANDQYTNFSLTGGFTNISHNPGTTCVGNSTGYASFIGCGLTERASIGTTIDFSITNNPTLQEGYAIWIDWNQNNTFETSEEVYASISVLSGSETVTGSFTVPTVAVSGRTKLRIRCLFNMAGTTIDPCSSGSYDYGISFDFPFYVTSIPPATLPVFTGGNMQSVAYCSTGTANSINTLMQVYDTSHSYSLTWSQSVAPVHGTLNASYSTTSNGGNSTPTGLNYTPNVGYIGQDSFIVVVNDGNCGIASTTIQLTVNPLPEISTPLNQVICSGLSSTKVVFTGSLSGTTYNWVNNNTSIGLAGSGIDSVMSFTAINASAFADSSTIVITPTNINGCTGNLDSFKLIINPKPNVPTPANQTICNGLSSTTLRFTSNVAGTTYAWANNDTAIGLAANGIDSIAAFNVIDTTNLIDTATIVVLPHANGCNGLADSLKIIVYPTPKVATVSNKAYCNGTHTSLIFFNGPVVGTSFTWTNNDTLIGLGGTGNDFIGSFTATDTSNLIDTAKIVIIPSANGCAGITDSFKIIVYPTPNVAVPLNQTLCNGMASTTVNFTSNVTGTTFAWTNSDTLIGLAASGIDSIASFTSIDTSNLIDTAIIAVMPFANGCVGFTQNFKIIVNPTPKVTQPNNVTVCSGLAIPTIHFTGNVLGTTFAWTNSDTLIGLSSTGIDSIHSFTSIDTSHIIDTATIMVTPTANGCSGVPKSFKIIVFPTPNTNTPANQILCNGVLSTVVNFTGTVNGTTYTWTNNDTLIGLAKSGIDSIAKFHAIDTGSIIDTATIVITPLANGCIGNTKNFMIIVNPTPNVTLPANQSICNGAATSIIAFTGLVDGTVFTWTNSDTTIGIPLIGSGNIASFSGINIKTDSVVDTIQVIPMANGCSGTMKRMMITVYPTPTLISNLADTICSESLLTYLPNSATNGVNYSWQQDSVGHITPTKWSGVNAINEALFNDTLGVVNVTYTYTLTANGCSNSENVVIRVNPTPQLPSISIHPPSNLCANTLYQNFGAANAPLVGEQYLWGALNASVWATGSTHQYAVVNFKNEGTSFVTLTANVAGVGCYKTDSFKVNVGATLSDTAQVIFYNNNFICLLNSQDSYQWGYDDKLSLDSTIISGETYQSYYNPTANFILNDYWVITTLGSCMQKTYLVTPNKVENIVLDNEDKIRVYPNPAEGVVKVEIIGQSNIYSEIKMFDLLGKIVKTATITNNKSTFNVAELLPGVYLLSCYSNDRKVTTIRFIKN